MQGLPGGLIWMEVTASRLSVTLLTDCRPTGITAGSQIYMLPGTKATLTDYITQGSTFVVPVIQNEFSQKSWYPIIGWAAFTVDTLGANSMTGHFVDNYFDPNVGPNSRPDPKHYLFRARPN